MPSAALRTRVSESFPIGFRPQLRLQSAISLIVLLTAGCGPTVDLRKALQIEVINTGWYDAGIVNGQNKLVPSLTFRVTNVSNRTLSTLQVNALFRRVTESDEWGSALVTAAGSSGLPPGGTTPP